MDNFFKSSFGSSGSGKDGAIGIQGVQGLQGTLGGQGIQGLQGTLGGQGIQGIQGITEAQGIQGIAGIGTAGIQGIQGNLGDIGTAFYLGNPIVVHTRNVGNTNANSTFLADTLSFIYQQVSYDFTFSQIQFTVTTGLANQFARILIYDNNDGIGRPNNLLYESPDVDCSSGALKTITLPSPFTFNAGQPYFIAWYSALAGGTHSASQAGWTFDGSNNNMTNPSIGSPFGLGARASIQCTFRNAPNPFGNPVVTLANSYATLPIPIFLFS